MSFVDNALDRFGLMRKPEPEFQEEAEDSQEDLDSYLTGDGLTNEERQTSSNVQAVQNNLIRSISNPASFKRTIRAREYSTIVAHNFRNHLLVDSAYYDGLDEAVDKDPDIEPMIDLFIATMHRRGWELKPANVPDMTPSDKELASQIRDAVHKAITEIPSRLFDLDYILDWLPKGAALHGFSVHEIIWDTSNPDLFVPCAVPHRHPGQFVFDDIGGLWLSNGRVADAPIRTNPNKFMLLGRASKYGNPYGRGIMDQLKYLYEVGRTALIHWVRNAENYGTPMAKAKLSNLTDETKVESQIAELRNMIKNLSAKSGVVLRPTQDLEFVTRGMTNPKTIAEHLMSWASRAKARVILGAVLHVFEAEFGSRAASETHSQTSGVKVRPVANSLSRVIKRDLVDAIVRVNFGPEFLRLAPTFEIETDDALDEDTAIKSLEAAGAFGIPASIDQAREWLNLRTPRDEEDVIPFITETEEPEFSEGQPKTRGKVPTGLVTVKEAMEGMKNFGRILRKTLPRAADFAHDEDPVTIEKDVREKTVQVADGINDQLRPKLVDVWKVVSSKVDANPSSSSLFPGMESEEEAELMVRSVFALSVFAMNRHMANAGVETETTPEFTEWTDSFKLALDWMKSRKVMTAAEVDETVQGLLAMDAALDEDVIERTLRADIFALQEGINTSVAEEVQRVVARVAEEGQTVSSFIDEILESGGIPGASEAYLENVIRTETASIYEKDQDFLIANSGVEPFVWGFELFNPSDSRSRPTHDAIDGLRLEKGSAADRASRPGPPYSYQCRCGRTTLIVADPENSDFKETPGALAKVLAIERF